VRSSFHVWRIFICIKVSYFLVTRYFTSCYFFHFHSFDLRLYIVFLHLFLCMSFVYCFFYFYPYVLLLLLLCSSIPFAPFLVVHLILLTS
jgi:hypothetical protein